ncbi:hypothetical protein FQ775_23305 [Nitratireductor mangrovi]|uniref:DUF4148 domain-containing protein n=1 Tax=Nitratireductor mangrovi TaxID=2599600 RepID=A0A5B8L4U0_9HYPH|nr:hypothetical protein [Nitratireductor mangrovi]QDZ03056.1 hypothetical protein FQ775_23305 [Nitratireductor mangrovi]
MRVHNFCAALVTAAVLASGALPAGADEYFGSYVARLSPDDHRASDNYPLDNAAQVVRQDRANYHKFGVVDSEDDDDPWFGTAEARAQMQRMLERPGAIDGPTRQAIMNGTPLVEVQVYSRSLRVLLLR